MKILVISLESPEIITDNYNGFLIPPNDSSVLSQKIEKLLYNEKLRREFIVSGLKTAKNKFLMKGSLISYSNILINY